MFNDHFDDDQPVADPDPFVGRDTERETIKRLLGHSDTRAVQVVGPPMVGKSRLAQKVGLFNGVLYHLW